MSRRSLQVSGLLAVVSLALSCGEAPPGTGSSSPRQGTPDHARLSGNRRIEDSQEVPREARRRKKQVSRGEQDPEALHDHGRLQLEKGRIREAIPSLEGAALQNPADAGSLNDLAAAYLIRGRKQGQPFDFVLALDAADDALEADADLPEALFNRAEALTRLELAGQAIAAWEDYLRVDSVSEWAGDARSHLDELEKPTLDQVWERELPRLESTLARNSPKIVAEIVSRLPHHARCWVEEKLLPAWGRDETSWQGIEDPLAAAGQIGAVLQRRAGDALVGDAVTAIARAREAGDSARMESLRRGHRLYGEAMELYRDQDFGGALPRFATARTALAAGGSPAVHWTELYAAIIDFYRAPDEALPPLRRLAGRDIAARYPAVAGYAEWMLGILEVSRNRPEQGLHWFRSSLSRLGESYGLQASANLHSQLAIAYQDLGQPDRAWEERLAGLAALRRTGDRRRLHSALYDMAEDLLEGEQGGPALAVAHELLDNALAWGNANALAESRLQRGRALDLLGRQDEALDELRAGRDAARKVPSRDIGERVLAGLDLAESRLLAERDPREALRLLDSALATHREKGFQHRIASLLLSRARAHRKLGDRKQEEADLRLAIEEHEKIREGIRDEAFRLSSFEQAQTAFDDMVRLQVEWHGDIGKAFTFAERARSRLLLDLVSGTSATAAETEPPWLPRALPADRIAARLPPGITLIEYMVLPDRLLAWVVQSGSIRLVRIHIPETELARAVAALRSTIGHRSSSQRIQEASAPLHRALIGPLAQLLPAGGALVFVPDRLLVQVPFSALFDAGRKRYLVEDHTIALAPSATLYLAALDRRSRMKPAAGDALVVGDPAFDRDANPGLDRLDAAAAEGAEIAELYPRSDLLRDREATRDAFLERAPGYRIVHFAGHALLHPTSPQLSRLLFAAAPGDSGSLFAGDLAGYRLDGTELVVLSACRTLGGTAKARESLVGLTAAFLAAGPPVVVSSLWKVEDRATRQLMLAFHRALRGGSDPAVALRDAQIQLLREPEGRFRSPNYWAPFEVFGGASAGEI